jgi:hypothetical protein
LFLGLFFLLEHRQLAHFLRLDKIGGGLGEGDANFTDRDAVGLEFGAQTCDHFSQVPLLQVRHLVGVDLAEQAPQGVLAGGLEDQVKIRGRDAVDKAIRIQDFKREQGIHIGAHVVSGQGLHGWCIEGDFAHADQVGHQEPGG